MFLDTHTIYLNPKPRSKINHINYGKNSSLFKEENLPPEVSLWYMASMFKSKTKPLGLSPIGNNIFCLVNKIKKIANLFNMFLIKRNSDIQKFVF